MHAPIHMASVRMTSVWCIISVCMTLIQFIPCFKDVFIRFFIFSTECLTAIAITYQRKPSSFLLFLLKKHLNKDLFALFLLMSVLKHQRRLDQNCEICTSNTSEIKTSIKLYLFHRPACFRMLVSQIFN